MAKTESHHEYRERKIREITEQLFQDRLSKLGQPAVLRDVADSVLDYLSLSDDTYKLAAGEMTFVQVRDSVMRNEAEVDATKAVDQMELDAQAEADDHRINQAAWAKAA